MASFEFDKIGYWSQVKLDIIKDYIGALTGLNLESIHWVIVGGESGPNCRPMDVVWVRQIYEAARMSGVPFFFKQWGGVRKDLTGRLLGGRTYDEMPALTIAAEETIIS